MDVLALCLVVQFLLAFGVTGLLWPERLMPVFGVLMFPWRANHRVIRANGVIALAAYGILVIRLLGAGL